MLWRVILLVPFLFGVTSCGSLPYKDDLGFTVSAQANSMEHPIRVNGKLCLDMDGTAGMCSKRISSKEDLVVRFDPQPYPYTVRVRCTKGLPITDAVSVPKNTVYEWKITAAQAAEFLEYTCIGDVLPEDREPPISSKFKVSVSIYDAAYKPRESMFVKAEDGKNYLVLGQYARSSWVWDNGKWAHYNKKTYVEIKGRSEEVFAYSESYAARYNYFGLKR